MPWGWTWPGEKGQCRKTAKFSARVVGGAESLFMKREDSVMSRSVVGRESGSAKIESSPPVTMEDTASGHPIFLISLRYDLRIPPPQYTQEDLTSSVRRQPT